MFTSYDKYLLVLTLTYFVATVAQMSASSIKELPRKKVKPNQKSRASVPEVEKKKKSFKLEIKQGR